MCLFICFSGLQLCNVSPGWGLKFMYFSCVCQPRLEPPAYPVVQHFVWGGRWHSVLSFHRVGPKDSIQIVNGLGEAVSLRGWKENANRCEHWLACLLWCWVSWIFFGFLSCIQKHLILLFGLMSIFLESQINCTINWNVVCYRQNILFKNEKANWAIYCVRDLYFI